MQRNRLMGSTSLAVLAAVAIWAAPEASASNKATSATAPAAASAFASSKTLGTTRFLTVTSFQVGGADFRFAAQLDEKDDGPEVQPARVFTSADGGFNDQCSANSTSGNSCSVGSGTKDNNCSAQGGNSHCSAQDKGPGGLQEAGNFCSSNNGGDQQCSVIKGEDSACSSRDAGNTCSSKAPAGAAASGGTCSVYGDGGSNGGAGSYCTSFYPEGGKPTANCSASGPGTKCSVKAGTKYTQCTTKDYLEMYATPKCSVLGTSGGTCSVFSIVAQNEAQQVAAGTVCQGDDEHPPGMVGFDGQSSPGCDGGLDVVIQPTVGTLVSF